MLFRSASSTVRPVDGNLTFALISPLAAICPGIHYGFGDGLNVLIQRSVTLPIPHTPRPVRACRPPRQSPTALLERERDRKRERDKEREKKRERERERETKREKKRERESKHGTC